MAALLRRPVVMLLVIALAMILVPATAGASGRDVLRDFEADGKIDRCYTLREYQRALDLLRPDDAQYGAAREVLQQARITMAAATEGGPCVPPPDPTALEEDEGDEGGGSSAIIWLVVAGAVGVVAVGTGAWVRRRKSGDDPPAGGDPPAGDA